MLRVSISLESNTLYTYIFIDIGIDEIIKTSKIDEASTKIKVEISLLGMIHAPQPCCRKHLF